MVENDDDDDGDAATTIPPRDVRHDVDDDGMMKARTGTASRCIAMMIGTRMTTSADIDLIVRLRGVLSNSVGLCCCVCL